MIRNQQLTSTPFTFHRICSGRLAHRLPSPRKARGSISASSMGRIEPLAGAAITERELPMRQRITRGFVLALLLLSSLVLVLPASAAAPERVAHTYFHVRPDGASATPKGLSPATIKSVYAF